MIVPLMRRLMVNKCAPLLLLKLGDSDKVLNNGIELAKGVCARIHDFVY